MKVTFGVNIDWDQTLDIDDEDIRNATDEEDVAEIVQEIVDNANPYCAIADEQSIQDVVARWRELNKEPK